MNDIKTRTCITTPQRTIHKNSWCKFCMENKGSLETPWATRAKNILMRNKETQIKWLKVLAFHYDT